MQFDVFNGDADGLCALLQLRLAKPAETALITGVKRDNELLSCVTAHAGDDVTVLDISLAKNRSALDRLLQQGASVFYVDHHLAGEIPEHLLLKTIINCDPDICTSLLIDDYLNGQYRAWAVVGAFGDNLTDIAMQTARSISLSNGQLNELQQLGVCINYNSYGSCLADLHFTPDWLYREASPYATPMAFIHDKPDIFQQLIAAYTDDLAVALAIQPEYQSNRIAVYILPETAWARRVSGVLGNELANQYPERAHAILTFTTLGDYQISVRAPLTNKTGADTLCSAFPTGGGRQSAAGINHLPIEQLSTFINAFIKHFR